MSMEFDIRKYKSDVASDLEFSSIVDGSDGLATQHQQVISFQNIRNKKDVFFKAFITAFNETYTPNFNSIEVFGRTDAIQQYKGTSRNITLAWKLPAASESEAYENLGRVQKLLQMLYPNYENINNSLTLSESPLIRLKIMNLLTKEQNSLNEGKDQMDVIKNQSDLFVQYKSTKDSSNGLLGVITSCAINHNLEGTDGVFYKTENTVLPKLIDINISFSPIHEETITPDSTVYPYGIRLGNTKALIETQTERGKSLSQLRELSKTLEEKRQEIAAAQSKKDKAEAAMLAAANAARTFAKTEDVRALNYKSALKTDEYFDTSEEYANLINEYNKLEDFL